MIRLENVTKRYKTGAGINTILNNVSLTFPKGHSVGILGGNGAGKSTLIRIIGNAEPPDSGRIIRHGRVSWPLGFTGGFQSNMTARENARFVARIYGESIDYIESCPIMSKRYVAIVIWPRSCMMAVLICMTISRKPCTVTSCSRPMLPET